MRALPFAFLFLISGVAYLNADHEAFMFDSGGGRITRPIVSRSPGQLAWSFLTTLHRPGQELSYLTFGLDYAFNRAIGRDGFDVTTFLATNVLIHAANACLVLLLVRAMLRQLDPEGKPSRWIPFALALLFAVHPMHASSVAYILQRRGSLATTFYILAVLAYLRARVPAPTGRQGGTGGGWTRGRIALAAAVPLCYALSCSAKRLGLTLPFAILAIEFSLRAPRPRALRRYLAVLLAGLAISAGGMFVFLWSVGAFNPRSLEITPFGTGVTWGAWEHFLTEARAFVHYWKLLLLPLPRWSTIDHDFELSRHLLEHGAIIAVAFHLLLLVLAVGAAMRGYVLAAAGVFWFYVALIPYILLPQFELLVEYKTYLPSVGLVLILAELMHRLRGRVSLVGQVPIVAALAALLLGTTISRNVIYQSKLNLWSDAVKKSPNLYRAHNGLAAALVELNRPEEAMPHLRRALELKPGDADIHVNLGAALAELGRHDDAVLMLREGIRLDPLQADARASLGATLFRMGRIDAAIDASREALKLDRYHAGAHMNLGIALAAKREMDEAMKHLRRAVELDPTSAEVHHNLANGLLTLGKMDEAVAHYNEALRRRPDYAQAHHNLGVALAHRGDIDGAIAHYREALRGEPAYPDALASMARALTAKGRIDEAIRYYRRALEINPQHALARQGLATLQSPPAQD